MNAVTQPSRSLARLMSAVAVLMLLMAQGILLEHEIEHALSDDDDSCLVCQLAGHQGEALLETSNVISVIAYTAIPVSGIRTLEFPTRHAFSPRGPPPPFENS